MKRVKCICFRAHVEFQLNQEPHLPFWFTPAQFAGRLIINYKATHIEFFEFDLPTEKQLNIGKLQLLIQYIIVMHVVTVYRYGMDNCSRWI